MEMINKQTAQANRQAQHISVPAFSQMAKPVAKTAGVTNWDVTKEQTVEGRLPGLIEANSPVMQLAESRAKQAANARGLVNSSMAVGAGQAAVLDAATGIATSDANILARSGEFNANAANQVGMFNAGEGNKFTLADADREFEASESSLSRGLTRSESELGRNFNQGENALDRTFRANESDADRALTRGENALGRDFTARQSGLDRTWRTGESAADRASNSSIAGMQAGASVSAASIRANADTANAAADRVWRTGESAADRTARASELSSDRTWKTDLSKSERGDQLFRDATSYAAAIDRDPDLSAEAKTAAKYEVFKNTEEYGVVQGLKLDLNFSDQYAPPTAEEKAAGDKKGSNPNNRDAGSNYGGYWDGDGSGGNGGSGGDNGSGGSGTSGSGQGGDGPGGGW